MTLSMVESLALRSSAHTQCTARERTIHGLSALLHACENLHAHSHGRLEHLLQLPSQQMHTAAMATATESKSPDGVSTS